MTKKAQLERTNIIFHRQEAQNTLNDAQSSCAFMASTSEIGFFVTKCFTLHAEHWKEKSSQSLKGQIDIGI